MPLQEISGSRLPDLHFIGAGLARPECVLTAKSGEIFASDRRGGVMRIAPDGTQTLLGTSAVVPNGVAMRRDRSFLLANMFGEGGVWRVSPNGAVEPYLMEFDGVRPPGVNFVCLDSQDRLWISVSTIRKGDNTYNKDIADGFVALHDRQGTRIVADGLCFTNECRLDAAEEHLYVNETFGRRLVRFRIAPNGDLSDRQIVAEFGAGTYPDGLAFDGEGAIWVVGVIANRLIRVMPDERQSVVFEDPDPRLDEFEAHYLANTLTRPMLLSAQGRVLKNLSSIAFGGPDLRTAYLGSLNGDRIAFFRAPIAGLPPVHWDW